MPRQISLRLPEALLERLDRAAKERKIERSELIRNLLESALRSAASRKEERPFDGVKDLVGALNGGPDDLSARHREYLRDLGHAR
jgi:Arc/MetJ-type ribon-helix-helix transcriptional regulator